MGGGFRSDLEPNLLSLTRLVPSTVSHNSSTTHGCVLVGAVWCNAKALVT
jgi:hypothetical protein